MRAHFSDFFSMGNAVPNRYPFAVRKPVARSSANDRPLARFLCEGEVFLGKFGGHSVHVRGAFWAISEAILGGLRAERLAQNTAQIGAKTKTRTP